MIGGEDHLTFSRDDTKWCECEEKRKWFFKG